MPEFKPGGEAAELERKLSLIEQGANLVGKFVGVQDSIQTSSERSSNWGVEFRRIEAEAYDALADELLSELPSSQEGSFSMPLSDMGFGGSSALSRIS